MVVGTCTFLGLLLARAQRPESFGWLGVLAPLLFQFLAQAFLTGLDVRDMRRTYRLLRFSRASEFQARKLLVGKAHETFW